ncbi:MAG: hypothetical protein KDA97_13785 [Acidimicrobiales bacterium]|nr:hypothetical protein [Acidimicrobiales bacterium]
MIARRGLGVVALGLLVVGLGGCGGADEEPAEPVRRVLVFTMPGVTWDEVEGAELPHLEALFDRSAIGDVSTRIGRAPASTAAGYLTVGAGTRAVTGGIERGVALNPDELHAGIPASDLLERRLGRTVDAIAYIPVGATLDANASSPYGAEPGLLGDHLDEAGVRRAVIANADAAEGFPTDQPLPDGAFSRSAATALMGSDGIVPHGTVGRGLLKEDPAAAFGRRLDPAEVLAAFDAEWSQPGPGVVLVEASDLSRAAAYAPRSTPTQARALRDDALANADLLLGELLERVDPATDAVLVLAPVSRSSLGIVSLATPEIDGGLVRSATTRRDGYVYLADVAPTILELVGEDPPDQVEGRPFDAVPARGDRVAHLADQSRDAAMRDARLPVVVPVVIAALVALTLATVIGTDRAPRLLPSARAVAIGALGLVPGTFLAGLVPAARTSDVAYAAVVVGVAVVIGVLGSLADRRRSGAGVLVGTGSILGVIGIDLLLGAPLQINSVFGYSMAVGGRFTGLGNLAFALFAAAGVCFAVVLHDLAGPRALPWIGVVLATVVLLDGLPMLGADVGGVSSVVPAFALTALALLGRRIGWRQLLGAVVAGAVVVGIFGLIDSSRPSGSKTHLARIGEHLSAGRLDAVATTMLRRLNASFGADDTVVWVAALALVAVALVQAFALARGHRLRVGSLTERPPGTVALIVGLGVLAVLGLVTNDSSIAVPATMLIVIVPVVILRQTRPVEEGAP